MHRELKDVIGRSQLPQRGPKQGAAGEIERAVRIVPELLAQVFFLIGSGRHKRGPAPDGDGLRARDRLDRMAVHLTEGRP